MGYNYCIKYQAFHSLAKNKCEAAKRIGCERAGNKHIPELGSRECCNYFITLNIPREEYERRKAMGEARNG